MKTTTLKQRIADLFSIHSCDQCGRTKNEASFSNGTDKLCYVCSKYQHGEEIFCCDHTITLYHGEPEICPHCGGIFIMWGASIQKIDPSDYNDSWGIGPRQIDPSIFDDSKVYICQVLHWKDGADEYFKKKEIIAKHIKDENLARRYMNFYEYYIRKTKAERQRIVRKYHSKW